MTRLEQLLDLRAQLDREIEHERALQRRIAKLHRESLAVLTRGNWNQRVLLAACARYRVDVDTLLAGARSQPHTDARHLFMYLMRHAGRSYPEIGRELGMDHTSAINGVRRVERTPLLLAAASEIHAALTGDPIDTESEA